MTIIIITTIIIGRDYSTVDGRSKPKCYWTRASCDCGMLQNGDVSREVKFVSNEVMTALTTILTLYLTALAMTLAYPHNAFVRRYFVTLCGTIPAVLTEL